MRLVEIRSHKIKTGKAKVFHEIYSTRVVPLLTEWETEVVAFDPSSEVENGYSLIRSYEDLADLKICEDEFYGPQQCATDHGKK